MYNAKRAIEKLTGIFLFLLMIFVGTSALSAEGPEGKTNFDLVIKDGLISLNANEASLKKIVEEIGRSMDIKVDVHIVKDEKITDQFDRLPLEEALKRLSSNYAYLFNSEEQGNIIRIVLLNKRHDGKVAVSKPDQKKPAPEPFKFELDPSQAIAEGKQ